MNDSDIDLLRQYAQLRSERAFEELVRRHVNLVYSVAWRQTRDPHLAEEIVQAVFVILARKAGAISPKVIVTGWLCRTARFVTAKAIATHQRRAAIEHQASMEPNPNDESSAWASIEPMLDDAMGLLPDKDHDILALRFFEGRSFKDIASLTGTTDAAAKMRVGRALEKLRGIFAKHGVTASVALITSTISANSLHAAPPHLATSVASVALKTGAASTSEMALAKTTLKFMAWTKLKTSLAVGIVVIAIGGGATAMLQKTKTGPAPSAYHFAGYATPEAAIESLIWGASTGDPQKYLEALTPLERDRFRNRVFAGKSDDEIRRRSLAFAKAMNGYRIVRKDVVSDDEVRVEVAASPSPDALKTGAAAIMMKKIGNEWKNAGDAQ